MAGASPLTTAGATIAALLIALGRPAWWLLALAGFLARGGIVLFLFAIVSLPSPLVLSNILAPLVTPLAFGTLLPETAALILGGIGAGLFWLIGGSLFAAATELAIIRDARAIADEEGLPAAGPEPDRRMLVVRVAAAHLLAHVPTALVTTFGAVAIVRVIYAELTNPSDAGSIALRVVAGAVVAISLIVAVWALGEIVGGLAVRRIVLRGSSVRGGIAGAIGDLVRRPVGSLIVPFLTMLVLAFDMAAVLAIVAVVLSEVRDRLASGIDDPVATLLTVATLGAAWSLALTVTGLIAAWRSVAMTFEVQRVSAIGRTAPPPPDGWQGPAGDGTIGASAHRRPGDRSIGDPDGSL
ncbi:MAG: hypothetical protein H0U52_13890 [Chloroflexi bacterium]|nr:hypothetical protein [Chloroflexota bacterium]